MFIKFSVILSLFALVLNNTAFGEDKKNIPVYLQDISVTIHANGAQGSGVVKTRNGVTYVLTAAHVVDGLRSTRTIVDPKTGQSRVKIEFDDAQIVKELYEDERSVGDFHAAAEIIRFSDYQHGEDLALLRIRKKNLINSNTDFCLDKGAVPIGTKLYHVGSLLGQSGSNSFTTGDASQNGRVLDNGIVFDQSSCPAFPGSSGGGIFRGSDGKYVGMLVRGSGETFNFYVPMRRIQDWAKRVGVEFVLDDSIPVPSDEVLRKIPVEEVGGETGNSLKTSKMNSKFPFLLYKEEKKIIDFLK